MAIIFIKACLHQSLLCPLQQSRLYIKPNVLNVDTLYMYMYMVKQKGNNAHDFKMHASHYRSTVFKLVIFQFA